MKDYSELFNIEKGYIALNHGSFGACPRKVIEHHCDLIRRMESLTTRFYALELKPLLKESLQSLAGFVNASAENMVFVRNATTAANSVVNSLDWQRGDEIVTTNLIYEACRYLLNFLAESKGVVIRTAQIPFPPENDEQIVSGIMNLINSKTKLVFIDHITSETAIIMPVEKISRILKGEKIPLFIDGAHAPGMIPLDLEKLAPDYYTGNCHKWLCAPKGSAFLYVSPERQQEMVPTVISFYFRKGETRQERFFNSYFWTGTASDYLSCCSVKKAIEYLDQAVDGGWKAIMEHNRTLVRRGREIIKEILHLDQYTPDELSGSMVTFKLHSRGDKDPETNADKLLIKLLQRYNIETFIAKQHQTDERILRISAHIYNKENDYVRLAEALLKEVGKS